ncbi:hypothetical protein [Luteibacter sp. 329MFSha]|uniref:hypothetical protein n=1 Tax=Luteibacter sp. 329MFSha TaxID=1798239 RepID=UPI0008B91929|nr:hypothetical protein [Luteibacter sp. 329MFSha]SEV98664.1 hypothetical protein SAMN04515660_1543 [Luteibacter sp. 329MFSha]
MTDITRTSRLLDDLRLRVKADRGASAAAPTVKTPAASAGEPRGGSVSPLARARRLHDAGVSDEKVLVGRLVEGLMLEEFGENAQGADFQFVLSQVVQALEQDAEAWALCRACVAEAIG